MKPSMRERLLKKGWTEQEVDYTLKVLEEGEEKKSKGIKRFEKIVYWLALIIAIMGNMIIAVVLIPFFLLLNALSLYFIIIMLGIGFGLLYDILIKDLENISGKEMVLENIFIPSLAIISVSFMAFFGNLISKAWNLSNIHNPLLVGFIYALAFISPWLVREYILDKRQIWSWV